MGGNQAIEKTFLELYDAEADAVYRFIYFKILDRDRAEEIVQEAFVRTWDYLVAGKDIENWRAFVYRVANNILVDTFRRKRELSLDALRDEGFDAGFEPLAGAERAIDARAIRELIDELDPKYRDPLVLRHVNGLSVKEIAVILDETENIVSVRIHRGLDKVRQLVAAKDA